MSQEAVPCSGHNMRLSKMCYLKEPGCVVVWELDLDLKDPGLNPCLAMRFPGCPRASCYHSAEPTTQVGRRDKKEP